MLRTVLLAAALLAAVSYGADLVDVSLRYAAFVDKILKGADQGIE